MTTPQPDGLRESLADLADQAEPADLYDRAVHRSRRIARREAAIGTAAALLVIGALASGLWRLPAAGPPHERQAAPGPSASAGVSAAPSAPTYAYQPAPADSSGSGAAAEVLPRHHKNQPQVDEMAAKPRSRSLTDLPGHVFYREPGDKPDIVRLSPRDGRRDTVLTDAPSPVGISPDGKRIAYVAEGTLLIGEVAGGEAEPVAEGVGTAEQAPAWSPGGDRLLVDADAPAVLEVDTGTITPLPGDLGDGRHFRWSGDGNMLVYATASCGLEVARAEAAEGTAVPVVGDPLTGDNPDGLAACQAGSVDATGRRVAVPLSNTGENAGPETADAVVDTTTGDLVALPVAGRVLGAVFDPEGNLLVRTLRLGTTRLSLITPDNTLLVQAVEPAAVRRLDLLAYTG